MYKSTVDTTKELRKYPSVPGKICWVKSEVLNTSNIGYVGPMWGKLLRRLSPIRGIDGLGLNPTYSTSEVTTDDCNSCLQRGRSMDGVRI